MKSALNHAYKFVVYIYLLCSGCFGVSTTKISYYESEKRDFNTSFLKSLCTLFQVSIDYLLAFSDDGIFVYYENDGMQYRINEKHFKNYINEGLIYYKDQKRYLDINKKLALKKETSVSDLLSLISDTELGDSSEVMKNLAVPVKRFLVMTQIAQLDDKKFNVIKTILESF